MSGKDVVPSVFTPIKFIASQDLYDNKQYLWKVVYRYFSIARMSSKAYSVKYRYYAGDCIGETATANRIFLTKTDADAFAKLSAEAYVTRYDESHGSHFQDVKPKNGMYTVNIETSGIHFYSYEIQLDKPLKWEPDADNRVFSIIRGSELETILVGVDRSEAIRKCIKWAKNMIKDRTASSFGAQFGDDDLLELNFDCEWNFQRATYCIELRTKQNDISVYIDSGFIDDPENAEKELEDYWRSEVLVRLEVVYTDVGPFDFSSFDGKEDKSELYEKVAGDWIKFMGGTFSLSNILGGRW